MKLKEIEARVGTLSSPSKMPCHGYSIPASTCKIGAKLRNIEGSICSKCYALKGRYVFSNVQNALHKRYESLVDPDWVSMMVTLISMKEKSGYFRWHDSGDLQGYEHLANICEVAKQLPNIRFWLPTREYKVVENYLKDHAIPENLTIRLSALMFDAKPPQAVVDRLKLPTSGATAEGFTCPSYKQDNKCGSCRACWDKSVQHVDYKVH
jgi:hypothetical protein